MYSLVPFEIIHMKALAQESSNAWATDWLKTTNGETICNIGNAFTFLKDGYPLVCGGVHPYWEGRGQLWSVFSERSRDCFVPTFRCIKKWLDEQRKLFRRIELSVDYDFHVGKRRAEMLGFELEVLRARKYLPNGCDVSLYSMVGE